MMLYLYRSFPAKEPYTSRSFAKKDLQLKASYDSTPPCIKDCRADFWETKCGEVWEAPRGGEIIMRGEKGGGWEYCSAAVWFLKSLHNGDGYRKSSCKLFWETMCGLVWEALQQKSHYV